PPELPAVRAAGKTSRVRHGAAVPADTDRGERNTDEDEGAQADDDEVGPRDIPLRVPGFLACLRDDLVPLEDDESETHGPDERDELVRARGAAEEGDEVRRGEGGREQMDKGKDHEQYDDRQEDDRDDRLRASR